MLRKEVMGGAPEKKKKKARASARPGRGSEKDRKNGKKKNSVWGWTQKHDCRKREEEIGRRAIGLKRGGGREEGGGRRKESKIARSSRETLARGRLEHIRSMLERKKDGSRQCKAIEYN